MFIEDKHHIGDLDLLHNESNKGENRSNIITFSVMLAIVCISAVFCCYLNYGFNIELSKKVFYMFLIAFVGDLLLFRPLLILLLTLIKFLISKCKCYKKIPTTTKLK